MLSRLLILLSCVVLCSSLVSDISHRFLQRNGDYEQKLYEPLYTSRMRIGGASPQLSPLYEMTNSHLLSLADLLRKRGEAQENQY